MKAPRSPSEHRLHESVDPLPGSFDARSMARGEPGLPGAFTWRGRTYEVADVERSWKETGVDRGDRYVRRHVFRIRTTDGTSMELYADRQARRGAARWWLRRVVTPRSGETT